MILIAVPVIVVPCYMALTYIKELVDIIVDRKSSISLLLRKGQYPDINRNQTVRATVGLLRIELSILMLTSSTDARDVI